MASNKILLKDVQIAYPSLYRRSVFEGVTGKFQVVIVIKKNKTDHIKKIKSEIENILKENKVKVSAEKLCLRDGDLREGRPEFKDSWYFNALTDKTPLIFDLSSTPITEEQGLIVSGCRVNFLTSFWYSQKFKGISANYHGLQYIGEGHLDGIDSIASYFKNLDNDGDDSSDFDNFLD